MAVLKHRPFKTWLLFRMAAVQDGYCFSMATLRAWLLFIMATVPAWLFPSMGIPPCLLNLHLTQ
jgi:hypothetical protein